MIKVEQANFKLIQEEKYIKITTSEDMKIDTLKKVLVDILKSNHLEKLDALILDDDCLVGKQEIIIHTRENIIEQYGKCFAYFFLDDKGLLISKGEYSYYYFEEGEFYYSEKLSKEEKMKVIPKIYAILSFFKNFHPEDKRIDLLYHDVNLVNYDGVKKVIEDEKVELVIPNFYEISPMWMKLSIVLKETKEIIGSIEFNFKLEQDNYYDYKGNVAYEIRDGFRGLGYATRSLALLRKYLNEHQENNILYITTETDNVSSQKVALKNDGILCYEGEVPKSSVLNFLGKVSHVKIYRIANM